jgi:predicted dehydrogenase
VTRVVLADPTGHFNAVAAETLGAKLVGVYGDYAAMMREAEPDFVVVAMEAALAPPVVTMALEAGCDVLAEKPAVVDLASFDELVAGLPTPGPGGHAEGPRGAAGVAPCWAWRF